MASNHSQQQKKQQQQQRCPARFLVRQLPVPGGSKDFFCFSERTAATAARAEAAAAADLQHARKAPPEAASEWLEPPSPRGPQRADDERNPLLPPEQQAVRASSEAAAASERLACIKEPLLFASLGRQQQQQQHWQQQQQQDQLHAAETARRLACGQECCPPKKLPVGVSPAAGAFSKAGLWPSKSHRRPLLQGLEVQQQRQQQQQQHQEWQQHSPSSRHPHHQQQRFAFLPLAPYKAFSQRASEGRCSCGGCTSGSGSRRCRRSSIPVFLPLLPQELKGGGPLGSFQPMRFSLGCGPSSLSTRCCSNTECTLPSDYSHGASPRGCCRCSSRVPRRSIQVLTGGVTMHDYYRLEHLLSVCTVPKAAPEQQDEQQQQQVHEQQHQQEQQQQQRAPGELVGVFDFGRPLLFHAVTRDERRAKRVVKVVKKKDPAQTEDDGVWRRMCNHLLNLPPHPNVLSFENIFETEEAFIFASEQLEGGELFDFLLREKTVEEDVCQFITIQILRAVDHLHSNNLLHRDVKPENLIFKRPRHSAAAAAPTQEQQQQQETPGSHSPGLSASLLMEEQHELLLIDFDTAMFIHDPVSACRSASDGQGEASASTRRRLVGTYGYLAPEVLRSGNYSRASDMWSVGVILYILMTGSPPVPMELMTSARSALSVMRDLFENGGIDFNVSSLPEFPLAQDLCRRLLEFDPSKRLTCAATAMDHPWLQAVRDRPMRISQQDQYSSVHPMKGCYGLSSGGDSPCRRRLTASAAIDAALVDADGLPLRCSLGDSFHDFRGLHRGSLKGGPPLHLSPSRWEEAQNPTVFPSVSPLGIPEGSAKAAAVTGAAATLATNKTSCQSLSSAIEDSGKKANQLGGSSSGCKSDGAPKPGYCHQMSDLLACVPAQQSSSSSSSSNFKESNSWPGMESGQGWDANCRVSPEVSPAHKLSHSSEWSCATTARGAKGSCSSSSSFSSVGGSLCSIGSPCCASHFLSPLTPSALPSAEILISTAAATPSGAAASEFEGQLGHMESPLGEVTPHLSPNSMDARCGSHNCGGGDAEVQGFAEAAAAAVAAAEEGRCGLGGSNSRAAEDQLHDQPLHRLAEGDFEAYASQPFMREQLKGQQQQEAAAPLPKLQQLQQILEGCEKLRAAALGQGFNEPKSWEALSWGDSCYFVDPQVIVHSSSPPSAAATAAAAAVAVDQLKGRRMQLDTPAPDGPPQLNPNARPLLQLPAAGTKAGPAAAAASRVAAYASSRGSS
ncbi:hypothetical protein ACSSS7_002477 [Eimeria intestinalis]